MTAPQNQSSPEWRRAMIDDAHEAERARRAAAAVQRCRHTLDDLVRGIER